LQTTLASSQARAEQAAAPVVVRADQVVARVDGRPLTGRQLLPFGAGDAREQPITQEMFQFLRQRAIDRELTFHEALTRGVDLTAAQQVDLAAVRRLAEMRGVTDREQIDFEESDARAELLQMALLARSGAPGPFPNEADVKSYYESHRDELDDLPADQTARAEAWQRTDIQIRQTLSDEWQRQYRDRLRGYLDQLRTSASVTD